jgi:hypothetical protein
MLKAVASPYAAMLCSIESGLLHSSLRSVSCRVRFVSLSFNLFVVGSDANDDETLTMENGRCVIYDCLRKKVLQVVNSKECVHWLGDLGIRLF